MLSKALKSAVFRTQRICILGKIMTMKARGAALGLLLGVGIVLLGFPTQAANPLFVFGAVFGGIFIGAAIGYGIGRKMPHRRY